MAGPSPDRAKARPGRKHPTLVVLKPGENTRRALARFQRLKICQDCDDDRSPADITAAVDLRREGAIVQCVILRIHP